MPTFCGRGSQAQYREAYLHDVLPGSVQRTSKYLGSVEHYNGNNEPDIQQHILAAKRGWDAYGRFWTRSGADLSAMRGVFYAMVVSPLVSGLEAAVLEKKQTAKLEATMFKYARKMLRGRACKRVAVEGVVRYTNLPNEEVQRMLDLVPIETELQVRRLKYWQKVAMYPGEHKQVIAAVLGAIEGEDGPTISPSGELAQHANPWACQL
eukprot:3232369-Alexandrium_andersonii.AAC.1